MEEESDFDKCLSEIISLDSLLIGDDYPDEPDEIIEAFGYPSQITGLILSYSAKLDDSEDYDTEEENSYVKNDFENEELYFDDELIDDKTSDCFIFPYSTSILGDPVDDYQIKSSEWELEGSDFDDEDIKLILDNEQKIDNYQPQKFTEFKSIIYIGNKKRPVKNKMKSNLIDRKSQKNNLIKNLLD